MGTAALGRGWSHYLTRLYSVAPSSSFSTSVAPFRLTFIVPEALPTGLL